MDLRSTCARAGWHPITSMISLHTADRGAYAPYDLYPMYAQHIHERADTITGRPVGSILQHELAHLDSARTTRFGWILGVEGGRALNKWRQGETVCLSPSLERVLGTLEPLLEGLALYAQLDFEARENEPLLPTTITHRVGSISTGNGADWEVLYRVILWNEIEEIDSYRHEELASARTPGLLRLLFLAENSPDTAHYFIGYLWIKAAIAKLRKECPNVARPALLYPIMTKLICDHVAISQQVGSELAVNPESLLDLILSPIRDSSLQRLRSVDFGNLDTDIEFDFLDLHSLLESGVKRVRDDREIETLFGGLGDSDADCANEIRTAAQILVDPPVKFKVLAASPIENHKLTLNIQYEDGRVTEFDIGTPMPWLLQQKQGAERRPSVDFKQTLNLAGAFQVALVTFLAGLMKQSVYVQFAAYNRVDWTGDAGFIFWPETPIAISAEDGTTKTLDKFWLPYTIWGYQRDLLDSAQLAFRLPPSSRIAFADALPMTSARENARSIATDYLARDLVSDPEIREVLISRRLLPIVPAHRRELNEWAKVPLHWTKIWQLPAVVRQKLDRIIDIPGFRASGVSADDLFPKLTNQVNRMRHV